MNTLSESTNLKKTMILILVLLVLSTLLSAFLFPDIFKLSKLNINLPDLTNVLKKKISVTTGVEKVSVFADQLHPIYGTPKKLLINSLGINLPIIPVGVDIQGYLQTPKDWNMAGWYLKGARPGEIGNLLINAHYDNNLGQPAAFYRLKNINLGDTVSVLDSYGKQYTYKVVNTYYIAITDPDRSKVFEGSTKDKSIMTLITCGGVWIGHTYDKRLVVNAELIQ
jgi:LPXTG-site transpeptidase (sortase) family protein